MRSWTIGADVVPRLSSRHLVGEVLPPQPEHLAARGRKAVVYSREAHGHEGRIARRFAREVVAIGLADVLHARAQQPEARARGEVVGGGGRRGVLHRLVEGEAKDRAEAVAHAEVLGLRRAVGGRQQHGQRLHRVRAGHHRARGDRLAERADPDGASVLDQDLGDGRIGKNEPVIGFYRTLQRLREHPGAPTGTRDAALVVERVPEHERTRQIGSDGGGPDCAAIHVRAARTFGSRK